MAVEAPLGGMVEDVRSGSGRLWVVVVEAAVDDGSFSADWGFNPESAIGINQLLV